MSHHAKGLLITALGVLIISPDTLLIRLAGLDVWSLAVWRGVLQAIGMTFLLYCFYGRRTFALFKAIGFTGVLLAIVFAGNTLTFLTAVLNTKVANALVIMATAPFFAAVLSYLFLNEKVVTRTWLAIGVAICGVTLLVADGLGDGTFFGDALALLAALLFGAKVTIIRSRKGVNMIPAMALSGLVFAAIALPFAQPLEIDGTQLLWVLLMGFAVITPATALITLGPRFLPAPEVSLLFLGETVLGSLWVGLAIGEVPSSLGIVGGAIVLSALITNAWLGLRSYRKLMLSQQDSATA